MQFSQLPGDHYNLFLHQLLQQTIVPAPEFAPILPKNIWSVINTAQYAGTNADKLSQAKAAANQLTAIGKRVTAYAPPRSQDLSAGPFVLKSLNPGEAILTKNPDFYAAKSVHVQQVEMRNYTGNQQIWNYLEAGQLDYGPYTSMPTNILDQILKTKGNQKVVTPSVVGAALAFNENIYPYGMTKVRQALAYVINRSQVQTVAEPVSGIPAKYQIGMIDTATKEWMSSTQLGQLNTYPTDPGKAAQLLTSAGFKKVSGRWLMPNGKPWTITVYAVNGFSDWIAAAKVISSELTSFGIPTSPSIVSSYSQVDQISRLSDHVFRSERSTHMAEEFPYLYSPHNARHWFVAEDGGQIRGIVGAMVWPAVIAGARTRVASVGSVATDPAYRDQGLASRLLHLAQSRLAAETVRIMLISGDLPLYRKFGARSIGCVDWYALPPNLTVTGRYSIRPIDPQEDAGIVARLYQTRSTRFGRTLAELRAMLVAQPITQVEQGIKVALLVLSGGVPVGYLILNHRPFQGAGASRLSEWAGDPKGVLYALTQVSDWPEKGLYIPVLREDLAMQGILHPLKPDRREAVSWLAKVIDGVGFVSDLASVWAEQAAHPPRVLLTAPDAYVVEANSRRWTVDAAELTDWVFSEESAHRPAPLETIWPLPSLWPEGLNYI